MPTFITFNIYLFYGLVFFSIGCVVVFRNFKYSQLSISPILWALALFSFSHAFHEWSELYVILFSDEIYQGYETLIKWLRLIKLSLSYAGLMIFAWLLFGISDWLGAKLGQLVIAVIVIIYTSGMIFFSSGYYLSADTFAEAALYTRWLLGFGSASLAAIGISLYGYHLQKADHEYGHYFVATGVGLFIYGVLSGLVPTDFHHSVPVFRTLAAGLILFTLHRALKVFDIEKELATEAKLKRAIEADKYKAIGHLAMGIAHEINNPLASSNLALDLLERRLPEENLALVEYLDRARLGIERASEISKELLTYARPNEGKAEVVPLQQVIDGAIQLLAHKAKAYHLRISCGSELTLYGHKVKLEELMINLINNAMDATEPGGNIEIIAHGETDYIYLSIRDWGEGMDSKTLERATELFYSTKSIGQGTGLGLAICEQILSAHQGKMNIESTLGEGTKVSMTFYNRGLSHD
ncbi:MAG: histidine kinase [Shewanella sp.]|nr:histidine kinase [Shewanella sp.]